MSRWLPLFMTTLGCMLLSLMIDKQHHLVISLTHLQEALSAVHNEHAKMQLNHFHIERYTRARNDYVIILCNIS